MRRLLNALLLVAGAVVLAFMIREIGWDELESGMRKIGWWFLLPVSVHLAGLVLDSYMLRAVSSPPRDPPIPIIHFIKTSVAGHGINEVIPMKAGELVKFNMLCDEMEPDSATAALVVQNLVMFTVNCVLLIIAPIAALAAFDVEDAIGTLFFANAMVFTIVGCLSLILLYRGIGPGPLGVLSKLGVSESRLSRWKEFWQEVRTRWLAARAQGGRMRVAWVCGVLSRLADVIEAYIFLSLLGVDHGLIVAAMSLASFQITVWITPFIPMQTGSMEVGAYWLFSALGLSPVIGVTVELLRRLRRVVFIALGASVLAGHTIIRRRER